MTTKRLGFAIMTIFSALICSCSGESENLVPGNENGEKEPVITTRITNFNESSQALEGENKITDMKACLFENGVMTQVYEDLQSENGEYKLRLDRYAGTLYMIANTKGIIDLNELQAQKVSENDWKKMTIGMNEGKVTNFFTGTLDLNTASRASESVSLKRGLVRFDLKVNVAGQASIESVTIKNAAQSAFLIPQGDKAVSPSDTEYKDMKVTFDIPLNSDKEGILYVYEQTKNAQEISIKVSFDGKEPQILTTPLTTDLKRNSIYTVTVSKDHIDVDVNVGLEDWEVGEDTELTPDNQLPTL